MKILMFGRGAISVMYGWALKKAGHRVEFYVRPGRAEELGSSLAINIIDDRNKSKGVDQTWDISLREYIPEDHDYDLIILSVQYYKFKEASEFLAKRSGKATILIFNNFWNDPQLEAAALSPEQLVWGFPKAGGSFNTEGKLEGALFKQVHFGTFDTDPTQRELDVRMLFEKSGFKITEHRDFKGWLWIHFATVAGFYSQALLKGTVGKVMASKGDGAKAIKVIREILNVVKARGIELNHNKAEFSIYNLPLWFAGFLMRTLTKLNNTFRVAFAGQINVAEGKAACRDVLLEAERLSVSVPLLKECQSSFQ